MNLVQDLVDLGQDTRFLTMVIKILVKIHIILFCTSLSFDPFEKIYLDENPPIQNHCIPHSS